MRIIVTGGSGFIGKYLVDELLLNNQVFVIGKQNINCISIFNNIKVPYFYTDYSSKSIAQIFHDVKPDAVVNLAAQRPLKGKNEISYFIDNLYIAANLFEQCFISNISNIINISTRSLYSSINTLPWIESVNLLPNNYYGLSKLWVEQTACHFIDKGLKIKTLRLAQVIGLGEKEGYLLQLYLKNAINGFPIKVLGNNIGKRQYIYVKDVVGAIIKALEQEDVSGIFNVGMNKNYSFNDLAVTINSVFGNKSEIIHDKEAKADENIYMMDISKAKNELNWQPKYDLEDAYQDIKKLIESNDLRRNY